jgi:hypothetical protein
MYINMNRALWELDMNYLGVAGAADCRRFYIQLRVFHPLLPGLTNCLSGSWRYKGARVIPLN